MPVRGGEAKRKRCEKMRVTNRREKKEPTARKKIGKKI